MLKFLILGVSLTLAYALQGCDYDGVLHLSGDSFKSSDGCNNCFCNNGAIACTLKACLPVSLTTCHYGNSTYQTGDSFKALDGCNTCGCHHGTIMCTEMFCLPIEPILLSEQ